jgi:hypothetical protein
MVFMNLIDFWKKNTIIIICIIFIIISIILLSLNQIHILIKNRLKKTNNIITKYNELVETNKQEEIIKLEDILPKKYIRLLRFATAIFAILLISSFIVLLFKIYDKLY